MRKCRVKDETRLEHNNPVVAWRMDKVRMYHVKNRTSLKYRDPVEAWKTYMCLRPGTICPAWGSIGCDKTLCRYRVGEL